MVTPDSRTLWSLHRTLSLLYGKTVLTNTMRTPKAFALIILAGGAAAVVTAVKAPIFLGAPLAFIGGAMAGVSASDEKNRRGREGSDVAHRVSGAFSALYERNRGLVDPVELSFVANVSLDQAHGFLCALAETTGATKINNNKGVGTTFNFPHSSNVLEELSTNAQNWAQKQTAALTQELEQHRQMIRAAQLAQATAPRQTTAVPENPWNNQS